MSTPTPSDPQPVENLPRPASATSSTMPTRDDFERADSAMRMRDWSQLPELRESHLGSPRRRVTLPIILFVATCLSTFWVGAANWRPNSVDTLEGARAVLATHWQLGLTYMGAVLAILLTHEMGHFLQTVRYRIPASYPLCIPVPFTPIGTMGAVISMDGMRANRKQIFDIGLAGPLAGLAVAIPILYIGVKNLHLDIPGAAGEMQLYNPVIVRWMIQWVHPKWAEQASWVSV